MSTYTVTSGQTSTGIVLYYDDYMHVSEGGVANETIVSSMGFLYVSEGGAANSTDLKYMGTVCVSEGGVANFTSVGYFGRLIAYGGVVNSTNIASACGSALIHAGGTANSTTLNNSSAIMRVSNGGVANFTLVSGYGSMNVNMGGTANSTVLSYGSMHVSNGGTANDVMVDYGGRLYVSDGGVVNNVRTDESGSMWIFAGGTMNNVVLSGYPNYPYYGTLNVSSGGVANNVYVKYGGHINVSSGGTATLAFDPWTAGTVNVSSGGVAIYLESDAKVYYGNGIEINKGDCFTGLEVGSGYGVFIYSGGSVDATEVGYWGSVTVSNGGAANGTVLGADGWYYGNMYVFSGGRADLTTVNAYNYADVYSGGTVNSTTVNSGGGLHISGGEANGVTLNSSAGLAVSLGGKANSVTIADHGTMHVVDGEVNSVTVNPGGALYFSGGTATEIRENGGYVTGDIEKMAFTPNVFSNVVLGEGSGNIISEGGYYLQATVHSGTTAVSTIVNNWGACLEVFSGGRAFSTLVNSGTMYVSSGGSASDVVMNSSGYLAVWGGEAAGVTVNSSGCLIIRGSGTVNGVTMTNSGLAYVSDGGAANDVMMGGSSFLTVYSGGTATIAFNPFVGWYASGIVSSHGGATVTYLERDANVYYGEWSSGVISKGNVFDNLAMTGYRSAYVYEGGAMNATTLESGGIYVSGGELNDTVINHYGWVDVSSGTLNRATVNVGGHLEISSGAAAIDITENGGGVWVSSGADVNFVPNALINLELSSVTATLHSNTTASGTLLGTDGYLDIFSGGSASGTTVGSSGTLTIYEGGTAAATEVGSAGRMFVYGTATEIRENGGYVQIDSDASATFVSNTLSGLTWSGYVSATIHSNTAAVSNTVDSGAQLFIHSGATAIGTTVSNGYLIISGGSASGTAAEGASLEVKGGVLKSTTGSGTTVYVSSGSLAEDTALTTGDWDLYMYVSSGGSARSTVLNGVRMYISSGATATDTTLNYHEPTDHTAGINVSSGGTADTVTVNSGCYLHVSEGGRVRGMTVGSDGIAGVSSGGTLAGRVNLAEGAVVSAYEGSIVDFELAAAGGPGTDALINNFALIQGAPDFTLTMTAGQAAGNYALAAGVTDFTKAIQVGLPDGPVLGGITVGGELSSGSKSFELTKTDDLLSLTITNEVRTNFRQNGVSQILGWDGEQGKVGYMATDGNPAPAWQGVWEWSTDYNPGLGASEAELWKVVAAGHFAGSTVDHDGILLYNGIGNTFAAWTNLNDPSYGYVSLCHVDGNFQTRTLTDLDGDEYDDVLIYDEKGSFGVVLDAAEYHDIWHVEDPAANVQELVGAGSFGSADGMDSLLVRKTDEDAYFLWHNNDPTFGTWDWSLTYIGSLDSDWTVAAIGDFAGDGIDDIAMWRKSTGEIQIWENGQSSNQRYAGSVDHAQWEVAAVGDYNCDGKEDLLLRETVTGWGGLGYWASADATQWSDLNARIETNMESRFVIVA